MSTSKPKFKGQRFTTVAGRLSFPKLFKPVTKYSGDGEEYTTDLLWDKSADISDFKKKCDLALAEVFGADKKKWPTNISYPYIDQEILIEKEEAKGKSAAEHLQVGAMYARFKTNAKNGKPVIVDQEVNEIIDPSQIYGGCYARVSGTLKVNVIKGKDPVTKKDTMTVYVTPYLSGVQKVRDADAFGGARNNPSDMFEAVEFDADDLVG